MRNPEPAEAKVGGDAESSSDSVNQVNQDNQGSWLEHPVSFVDLVRKKFKRQPETYREFSQLMGNVINRACSDSLIFRVHLLFKEHKELLVGFNEFLPKQYKDSACLRVFDIEEAVAFVRKIKHRFSQEPNAFESFRQSIYKCRAGTCDLADTFIEISKLFEGHPDLLMEYWKYVPPIM